MSLKATCAICLKRLEFANLSGLESHLKACQGPSGVDLTVPELPYVIILRHLIKSQNDSQWAHWSVYSKYKNRWAKEVERSCGRLAGLNLPYSVWNIRRVYTGRQREMDFGNLVGGCKPIPDALKQCRIIYDDAPKYFSCSYEQVQVPDLVIGYVELTLKAVTNAKTK